MKRWPAVLYHLLPLIPLSLGYPFGAVAAALLVALAYIKVFKLRQAAADWEQKHGSRDEETRKTLRFWTRLTFLPVDGRDL